MVVLLAHIACKDGLADEMEFRLLTAAPVVFTPTCLKSLRCKFIYAFKTCTGRKLYRTSKITEKFSQSLQFRNRECEEVAEHSLRICVVTSPFLFLPTFGKGHCPFRFRSATPCPRRCKGRPLSVVIIFHNSFAIIHPYYVHVYRISTTCHVNSGDEVLRSQCQ